MKLLIYDFIQVSIDYQILLGPIKMNNILGKVL